jgi:GTP cyclohydrolase I
MQHDKMDLEHPNPQIDRNQVMKSLKDILAYVGDDPGREGLIDTPNRIIKSWDKLFSGYRKSAEDVLGKTFRNFGSYQGIVTLDHIEFYSTCEHHFLPFFGQVHIGYIPRDKVVGISKLARLVEIHARRLQIQEKMTADIADDIQRVLNPLGVAVVVEGKHFCITSRGVEKRSAIMRTSKLTGLFEKGETRKEFFDIVNFNE